MTPLERAARAVHLREPQTIEHHRMVNGVPTKTMIPAAWSDLSDDEKRPYFETVRAILAAIREPSDDQLIDMQRALVELGGAVLPSNPLRIAYRTGIDAALAEGE